MAGIDHESSEHASRLAHSIPTTVQTYRCAVSVGCWESSCRPWLVPALSQGVSLAFQEFSALHNLTVAAYSRRALCCRGTLVSYGFTKTPRHQEPGMFFWSWGVVIWSRRPSVHLG